MADLKINPATPSNYALDQTIVFLRPTSKGAILGVNATENDYCRFKVAPPEEPTDLLLEETLDEVSGVTSQSHTPVKAAPHVHPFALRLGFDTFKNPPRDGFTVGGLGCNINLPTLEARCYFVINYLMESGAPMITASMFISIGDAEIRPLQSLLLMHISKNRFQELDFLVEFPDLRDCVQSHKAHYQRYTALLGFKDAPYFRTSLAKSLCVGSFRTQGVLGQGSFGIVHKVVHQHKGTLFAMKLLNGKPSDYKEVEILKKLRHDHIIKYHGSDTLDGGQLCIIMELAANDLFAHIEAKQEKGLSLECIRSIARQAISALAYLHSQNVTHRDVKPANILVTNWDQFSDILTIKLADFGFATSHTWNDTFCGTNSYMAPEIAKEKREEDGRLIFPYTNAVDIWAMGKVLLNLILCCKTNSRYPRNKQGGYPNPDYLPAIHLIAQMTSTEAKHRPTAAQCLESPWLQPEESFSKKRGQKRKASPDPINHRAQGPGPGTSPAADSTMRGLTWGRV